ncbi:MAG: MgtC/SapB family protein [Rhodanobacteraceae bacterium]|nr:MgtC/SapB family protein [Rhodanobacteraceae bacterium]
MPPTTAEQLFALVAALGGGLLVGIGRERDKTPPDREAAGVRSFTIVALGGAIAMLLGPVALAVVGAAIAAMTVASYWHSAEHDPGVVTELALLVTFLLGALAQSRTQLAAALFVVLAVVLESKTRLHRFTRQVLSEQELSDALLLAAAALIVLPLLPDRAVDPWQVLNPRKLWLFAVLVMAINALGYIALRVFGAGRGLALAGLLGGFVSSAATIAAMGQRASSDPQALPGCIAAALLSCVATVVQLALILFAIAPGLLVETALPLLAAGLTAAAVAVWFVWRGRDTPNTDAAAQPGRPFALGQALLFVAIVAAALLLSAALRRYFGDGGVLAAAAAAGFADVHAAAVSLGQLAGSSDLPHVQATWALAAAFTTNSLVKCFAAATGGAAYARPVVIGVLAITAALVGAVTMTR